MCIWQDSLDHVSWRSACQSTVSQHWWYSKGYPLHTQYTHLDSSSAGPLCTQKLPKTLTSYGIPPLELCYPHLHILTLLVPSWNGILLMDSRDNVILFWLPGSGIVQNKLCLLKSDIARAWYVKFLMVHWWGIQLFDHSITQETSKCCQSFWTHLIAMFCTLLVFIKYNTSSGNTLSAMSISFCSLVNCIDCSWVVLKTYCTGCSDMWIPEMSGINLTIDSHRHNDIQASSSSPNHPNRWQAAPGRELRSGAWLEHWVWTALQFLTAPRMTGILQLKQPLM